MRKVSSFTFIVIVSKIYKNSCKSTRKWQQQYKERKRWGKGVYRMKKIQITSKHVNRYLTSKLMVIREMQIKSIQKYTAASAKSLQSCPTLCDPIDGSPPGSPVPGILQAGTLKWVAMSSSNESESESEVAQPTRLLHPWDFPGKSTEVGCHCLLYRAIKLGGKWTNLTIANVGVRTGNMMTHLLAVTCRTAAEHPLQQCSPDSRCAPTETLTLTNVHKQIWTRMSIAALFVVRTKDKQSDFFISRRMDK